MLDSETKRRIDTARDILVGKVPDPKSQVEQITIALIYKFMDDMDAEAEELGGKRSFFVGEFEKFSWAKLMSPSMGGYDVLNLYGEAIDKMTRNEGVPQLFRDIFKNAYLPYRDPETLKLFLKTINEFNYDHSEKLGDAFEYLLSVLGSQGDAGQFRTPRHIIDFMVKVVDPQKDESILDPACGTAGFLISAYKHVLAANEKDGKAGGALKPAERTKLANNIRGYDISPDMVRLSLVNLYLHGFATPNIYEYDTLTSEERWDEYADVILANPPFMSPKGGIKPHKRFSVQSNRSEVLFVDYMAEHLTPNGRAAIIVPEGIIFQSAGAYKQLRKYLIESNYLWAVVSLPAGVFNPYAGVKTSILLLDRSLAKKTDKVLFVKVEADGFDLGAQRRPIDRNDLPDALNTLRSWQKAVLDGQPDSFVPTIASALLVSTSRLAETGDYNLSPDRYREVFRIGKQTYPMVALKDVTEVITKGTTPTTLGYEFVDSGINFVKIESITQGGQIIKDKLSHITQKCYDDFKRSQLVKNDVLFSIAGALGRVAVVPDEILPANTNQALAIIRLTKDVDPEFVSYMLRSDKIVSELSVLKVGVAQYNISLAQISNLKIPLPPLEIQRQIVGEIAAHKRIIDGARQVVEGWKPDIEFDAEWSIVKLEELFEITSSKRVFESQWKDRGVPFYRAREIVLLAKNGFVDNELFISEEMFSEYASKYGIPKEGDMMVTGVGTLGVCYVVRKNDRFYFKDGNILWFKKNSDVETRFIEYLFQTDFVRSQIDNTAGAVVGTYTIIRAKNTIIPLPPLEIQREIVGRIEAERQIVEGNRELIRLYEAKIKQVIAKVWEG